nr:unnamed protein product [Callosobruchus analis]
MPSSCCVPRCNSNYKKDLKEVVFSKHFLESEIITVDTITRPDGSILTCPRKIPKLLPTAIPTIFPNQPSYMTVKLPQKQNPGTCMRILFFFLIDANNIPNITCSFKVKFNLEVEVYYKNLKVPSCKFEWILSNHLKGYDGNYIDSKEDAINFASEFIQKSLNVAFELTCEQDLSLFIKKTEFFKEQLGLTIMSKPRYSSNMLLWASTLYFQFPGAYKMLRDTGCLTLPHPIYLSQITADIKTDVGIKQSQIQYLKREVHEKFINILFDEIHIAPKVEYRGGVLRGLTEKN